MVKQYPKISTAQLFCILMLSRLSSEMVYPRTAAGTAAEAILATVISEVVRFILALPIIIYSFKGSNFHRAVYKKNSFIGWTGGIIAAILLIASALKTMLNLSQFAVKNLLTGGALWLIFALAAAFAVFCAIMGTEAAARSGAIFLVLAVIITITVMLGDIPFINKQSFESVGKFGDYSSLFSDIIERVMRGGEYLIFAALLPYVSQSHKSNPGRTVILFAVFSTLSAALICFMNCLILREMYSQCEFPFLAAASLSDISLFKRLDGFAAAVWALCAAFRSGVMLLSTQNVLLEIYRSGHSKADAPPA